LSTSSSSSARSTWRRVASALLCLACAGTVHALPVGRLPGSDIERAWVKVVASLDAGSEAAWSESCNELLQVASQARIRRLTPFSLALVARSRLLDPPLRESLLRQAVALDPDCPEAHLALVPVALSRGHLGTAVAGTVRFLHLSTRDSRIAAQLWSAALLSATVAGLLGFAVWAMAGIRRTMPRLWHDLGELACAFRLGVNGTVLSVLLLCLPLVVAGDPVWLLLWLFALSWAYLDSVDKVAGAVGLLFVIVSPLLFHGALRTVTQQPNPILRATAVLAEGRYDPLALQELQAVADVFGDQPEFYRLQGDLYRQFNLLNEAALAYQEGLRRGGGSAELAMALGTVRYQEGDYNAALQAFQAARDAGADAVVANFNLSLALAQTYNFKESDEAMGLARRADPRRLRRLTQGNEHQVILVPFSLDDARRLLASQDPVVLLNRGIAAPPTFQRSDLFQPLALAGLVALFVAGVHFFARASSTGFASACAKCGRAFCRRCRLSGESQSYCTQCVNIFLKKDMVAIDAQLAKRRQLARRQLGLAVERRVFDLLVPGVGLWWSGRRLAALATAPLALGAAAAVLFWLPRVCGPVALFAATWPLQVLAAGVWAGTLLVAQLLSRERR